MTLYHKYYIKNNYHNPLVLTLYHKYYKKNTIVITC